MPTSSFVHSHVAESAANRRMSTIAWALFALMSVGLLVGIAWAYDGAQFGFGSLEHGSALPAVASVLIALAVACGLTYLLGRHMRSETDMRSQAVQQKGICAFHFILLACAAILFVLQCVLVHALYGHPGWDAGILYNRAWYLTSGMSEAEFYGPPGEGWVLEYYDNYPNNAFITYLFKLIAYYCDKLNLDSLYTCCQFGALSVCMGGFFCALTVRRLTFSNGVAYLGFALYALLFGLAPWVSIAYSDTYVCGFIGLLLYLCVGALAAPAPSSAAGWARAFARWLFIGLVAFVGYLLKPTAAIVLLAAIVAGVVNLTSVACRGARLPRIACCAVGLAVSSVFVMEVVAPVCYDRLNINPHADEKLGMAHFLMMGQNDEHTGAYREEDVSFSQGIADPKERSSADISVALERIGERGLSGNLAFWGKKALFSFGDGAFSWCADGGTGFIATVIPSDSDFEHAIRGLFYIPGWQDGADQTAYRTWSQLLWYLVLALWAVTAVRAVVTRGTLELTCRDAYPEAQRKPSRAALVLPAVVLMGMFLYLMLFEDRGRYLYCLGPVSVTCAMLGLASVARWVSRHRAVHVEASLRETEAVGVH